MKKDTDRFNLIIADTLAHEGGYVHDPADPGGETNFGISKRSFPELNIKTLSREQAVAIYCNHYWLTPRIDAIDSFALARKIFDLGVNCGTRTAILMLQRAVNTVCLGQVPPQRMSYWRQQLAKLTTNAPLKEDGLLGPVSLGVINRCPHPDAILMALRGEAYNHYRSKNPLYIVGWLKRLAS